MTSSQYEINAMSPFPTVGVVGGGQLARMMQPAATALGVRLHVLADSENDSAAKVIPTVSLGDYRDDKTVEQLTQNSDVLTFEHEHVPSDVLHHLSQNGANLQPPPAALRFAQNKLTMRQKMQELQIPSPDWELVTDLEQIEAFRAAHGGYAVIKAPTGGYDGRGVLLAGPETDLNECVEWLSTSGELLVEQKVDFVRELAVLVARSPSGQNAVWPVAETRQTDGICDVVIAPAPNLNDPLADIATRSALTIADALGVTGVMAVEGFETADGQFLVNELAMRPHNSGHWTIDGSTTSQFEQHLRAVLDLPLGDTHTKAPVTVMVNVLGADHPHMYPAYRHVMARDPEIKIHMYGKEVRSGRKVGHVTITGNDADNLISRARHAADYLKGVIDE